jgi:alpha-D-ribose 1-methylphosphonate 5-triphosphate synthase subunit PhnL
VPFIVLVALILTGCSMSSRTEQLGVEVFAEDTIPVRFGVTMSGGIEMRVNAERAFQQADRSLVFETPATLLVSRGSGEAIVTVLDENQRIAVQPLGIPADSIERAAVVGRAVQITRLPDTPRLELAVAKP